MVSNRNPELAECFGKVMRRVRLEQGIAQETLALLAGMDRSYAGRVERGEKQPSLDLVIRIGDALGLPPDSFVKLVVTEYRGSARAPGKSNAK
jgi:XRE family transcriptional regulator, regulator of sulfur utilization